MITQKVGKTRGRTLNGKDTKCIYIYLKPTLKPPLGVVVLYTIISLSFHSLEKVVETRPSSFVYFLVLRAQLPL